MNNIQNWMNNHYGNATTCMASVSHDRIRWHEVEVTDISTRGLKFYSTRNFNVGEILNYDLHVYSMLTAFEFGVEGCITEKETLSDGYNYSVEFNNLDRHVKIQLDEIFNANIAVKNKHFSANDGIHSFVLNPRSNSGKHHYFRRY
ncbi:PilZ domain-containing protein [Acetivibrio mesophilus]|uniref:PilZ domain-containing protein n=1 Tax=Acetivibrio mesophilus TaxID=2487273 RepID=A0A4Q0I545_9FIRM|nr:PilZ domain-containing protein [Acetivibrio mesophilus]RXE59440.1 PilZ domain-containing protein [Acetivibrio mesophilus]